jgi:hypothetical protein
MQITIRHYDFALDAPYEEGHVLTLGEAQALNGLRAENIRNNISKVINAKLDALPEGHVLSVEEVAELQALVDDYASRYFFKFREGKGDQRGQLSAETYAIARDRVSAILRAAGQDREPTQGEIAEMQRDAGIQAEARANIEARALIARQALEEL